MPQNKYTYQKKVSRRNPGSVSGVSTACWHTLTRCLAPAPGRLLLVGVSPDIDTSCPVHPCTTDHGHVTRDT